MWYKYGVNIRFGDKLSAGVLNIDQLNKGASECLKTMIYLFILNYYIKNQIDTYKIQRFVHSECLFSKLTYINQTWKSGS
jgi:hypothetical protein